MILLMLGCAPKAPVPLRPHAVRPPHEAMVNAEGTWRGTLQTPRGPTPLQVEIIDGAASVTVGPSTAPATWSRTGSDLRVQVPVFGLAIVGSVRGDSWNARWTQAGRSLPVRLDR